MSLAWFGPASQPSGGKSTMTKRLNPSCGWPLLWTLRLLGWLAAPLLWSSTPPSIAASKKRRGSWLKRQPRRPKASSFSSWDSTIALTITPRLGHPPLVTIHQSGSSSSCYGLRAARQALSARGVPSDDPLIQWLWSQQEAGCER
jgi:hypothetical protein